MSSRSDYEQQKFVAACEKRRKNDEWLQKHQECTRMHRGNNKARLLILVDEAYRLEKLHLGHQLEHCKNLIGMWRDRSTSSSSASSPSKSRHSILASIVAQSPDNHTDDASVSCPCTRAFSASQLQPKFRALHLLMKQFPSRNVEASFEAVRNSYHTDDDMLVDLIERYGPEDQGDVNIRVWLANVEQRLATLPQRWRSIREKVEAEMSQRDNSAMVIRCLSVMRIFVEGSQSETYGVDVVDRNKRDTIHQALLDELIGRKTLFL